jgi:hypothetical protein
MELELGSPSVDRCESRGRRRASAGGTYVGHRRQGSGTRRDWLGQRIEAHGSRDVGDHAEDDGRDEGAGRS